MRKFSPHENIIIKIQALIRGFLCRKIWVPKIKMVQEQKRYKEIALSKVKDGLEVPEDDLNMLTNFFEDDLEKDEIFTWKLDIAPPDELKEMMQVLKAKPSFPSLKEESNVVRNKTEYGASSFPNDMNPGHTTRSNSSKISEISRKMLENNQQFLERSGQEINFHGPGVGRESSPTSVSNAITEVDMNTGIRKKNSIHNLPQIRNNYMNSSNGSVIESQISRKNKRKEEEQKRIESWGFNDESTKQVYKAWARGKTKKRRKILTQWKDFVLLKGYRIIELNKNV